MTDSTDRAISAAESLKFLIEKTKKYNHLWEVAGEIIALILAVSAILLLALLLILNYDFDNLVTNFGVFRLSAGNYLDVFNILELATGIVLYAFVYRKSKVIKKELEINKVVPFEHGDIKSLVKFIVSQDWDSLLRNISRGKNSFFILHRYCYSCLCFYDLPHSLIVFSNNSCAARSATCNWSEHLLLLSVNHGYIINNFSIRRKAQGNYEFIE